MVADFSHLSPVDEVEDFLHEVVQKDGFAQAEAKISKRVQRWALLHNFEETNEEIIEYDGKLMDDNVNLILAYKNFNHHARVVK